MKRRQSATRRLSYSRAMIWASYIFISLSLSVSPSLFHDDWFDWNEEVSSCNRTTVLASFLTVTLHVLLCTFIYIYIYINSRLCPLLTLSITNDYVNRQSWVVIEKNIPMKDSFVFNKPYCIELISKWLTNEKGNLYWSMEFAKEKERKKERKDDVFEKITITLKETLPYQNITLSQNRL